MKTYPPIAFTRSDVATMIRVAIHFNPRFCRSYSTAQLRLMAAGRMKPRPVVLALLNLTEQEGKYLWHAR